jgi:CxxC motif-containing protein (DUF1111 family)
MPSDTDTLARLMGSITNLFPGAQFATMDVDGKAGMVSTWYCQICADRNGGRGYPDCEHKQAVRFALRVAEMEANDDGDLRETQRAALGMAIQ